MPVIRYRYSYQKIQLLKHTLFSAYEQKNNYSWVQGNKIFQAPLLPYFSSLQNLIITILFAIARPNAQYGIVQSTGIIQGSRIVAPGK